MYISIRKNKGRERTSYHLHQENPKLLIHENMFESVTINSHQTYVSLLCQISLSQFAISLAQQASNLFYSYCIEHVKSVSLSKPPTYSTLIAFDMLLNKFKSEKNTMSR
jgi:hypothetical protein